MQGTLVRPVAQYPAAVVTDQSLKVAANKVQTSLRGNIGAGDTIITVGDASRLVKDMLLTIDSEIVSISAISGNTLTVVRGFDGTFAASHASGRTLSAEIDAWHHNALVAEVEAIEAALGPNLANVGGASSSPFVIAGTYNFTPQSPGGSLVVGANVITLSPVPRGVNGTNKHHWLWIDQGTGTPEAVEIIGGTAVSGATSGTVIVNCTSAHSGGWSIGSATGGIQEALYISRYVAVAQQLTVIHAPVYMDVAKQLYGAPIWGSEIKQASANTDCIWIGDNGTAQALTCTISGIAFSTSSGAWTSGWAINCRYAGYVEIRDCYIYGNSLIWGGINLYRCIRANLWNNYISATRSHGVSISGQDAVKANQSITCNVIHCEFASNGGNAIRIGEWTQGLSFRDCIFNGLTSPGISFNPTNPPSGVNINFFISECDMEGAGIYAQNVGNLQIVNCWISSSQTISPLKLASTVDTVLFADNIVTGGGGGAGYVPMIDTNGANVMITGNNINGGVGAGSTVVPALIAVGANANKTTIASNYLMIADVVVQIDAAANHTAVTGNSFTVMNTPISGKGLNRYVTGNKGIDEVQAGGMTAAATISPVNPVQLIVGTAAISTITVPDAFSGKLTLLPANAFTWTASGNIFVAGTAVAGKALDLVYDTVDSKWWPSYT